MNIPRGMTHIDSNTCIFRLNISHRGGALLDEKELRWLELDEIING